MCVPPLANNSVTNTYILDTRYCITGMCWLFQFFFDKKCVEIIDPIQISFKLFDFFIYKAPDSGEKKRRFSLNRMRRL